MEVDVGVAQDVPPATVKKTERLGGGPSILVYDGGMIPNRKLRDLMTKTADQKKILREYAATEGTEPHEKKWWNF